MPLCFTHRRSTASTPPATKPLVSTPLVSTPLVSTPLVSTPLVSTPLVLTLLALTLLATVLGEPVRGQSPVGFQPPNTAAGAAAFAPAPWSRPPEAYQTAAPEAPVQTATYATASVPQNNSPPPASRAVQAAAPQQAAPAHATPAQASPVADANPREPIPLPPRSGGAASAPGPRSVWQSVVSTGFALLLVLGVFGGLAVLVGRNRRGPGGSLPPQVFEVLGRSACMPRQQVLVIRFGPKLLLVSHEPGNVQTLGEIDSPAEVDRLAGLCEQQRAGSVTANFQHVLQSVVQGGSTDRPAKRWFAASSTADAA